MRFRLLLIFYFLLFSGLVLANNVEISNLVVDEEANTLNCQINWENSWHNEKELALERNGEIINQNFTFKDGIWCFLKIRTNDYKWKHIFLSANDISIISEDAELKTVSDRGGFFLSSVISPEKNGFSQTSISIKLPNEIKSQFGVYDITLYAIEMVWVDEGSFFVGDGVYSQNALRKATSATAEKDSSKVEPFLIDSENEIQINSGDNLAGENKMYGNSEEDWSPQTTIPASFPKGFEGFWIMKYEINQKQYADFLNTLTFKQQIQRTAVSPENTENTLALAPSSNNSLRNGICIQRKGNESVNIPAEYGVDGNKNQIFDEAEDGLYRACNWLNAEDVTAFLDWAALRPITELEFEKATRGITNPIKGDFSWGTSYIIDANTVEHDGQENETVTETANVLDSAGLAPYNTGIEFPQLMGVLRNGFGARDKDFSSSEFKLRLQAGASFWGILEMSGNVWELCVKLNNLEALSFSKNQVGDGTLTSEGNSNAWSFFPSEGLMVRGGAWDSVTFSVGDFRDLSISARYYATLPTHTRRGTTGGRGGR